MKKTGRKQSERLPEQVLSELAAIGLTRATDVLYIRDGAVELKEAEAMGAVHAAAISSVEKTSGGWKVKFYDKLKALELLGDHLGLFRAAGTEQQAESSNLLEAILASTGEVIDTSDIQELQQAADVSHDLVEPSGVS